MQIEITPIFLVLAAIIGLLIGLLVSSLFSSRDSKLVDTSSPPETMAKEGFAEAARLWYSPGVKKVITELDGEYYRDFLVLSPEQKSRVNKMIGLWSDWAGKSSETSLENNREEPTLSETERAASESEPLPPLGPVLDWSVAKAIETENKGEASLLQTALKPKTIAGQISLVLDKMLEGNPLKEKGIRLIENSSHGVDVWIGLEKFDGINAIPYPEVQQFIRAAVVQWEREMEAERNQI